MTLLIAGPFPVAGQSLDHDQTLPIEISADTLEVAQEDRVATFAGNVDAVQGDLVLSADKLKVHYEGKGQSAGLAAGTGGTINQIEASGDVILSSPEETAEGDLGVYDVPARLITLSGNVVLTRGENIIRGTQLKLDLATGKSRMIGTTASTDANETDKASGRVKALFTPKQKPEEKENDADAPTPHIPLAKPK
ncbi:MAG: lipopolysaccharide transport periplasmic protein LptA [Geminicoccaceae bacterium]